MGEKVRQIERERDSASESDRQTRKETFGYKTRKSQYFCEHS